MGRLEARLGRTKSLVARGGCGWVGGRLVGTRRLEGNEGDGRGTRGLDWMDALARSRLPSVAWRRVRIGKIEMGGPRSPAGEAPVVDPIRNPVNCRGDVFDW